MTGASRKITFAAMPTSVNAMFKNVNGRGRVKTKEYHDWQEAALWEIVGQRIKPIDGEVSISIGLVAQDKRSFDIDNRIKGALDTLVKAKIIQDDNSKIVRRVSVELVPAGSPCTVIIQTYEGSAA